jgi:hypothetical protein
MITEAAYVTPVGADVPGTSAVVEGLGTLCAHRCGSVSFFFPETTARLASSCAAGWPSTARRYLAT